VKFGQNPISGFRGEDVKVNILTHGTGQATTDDGKRPVTIAHREHFVYFRLAKRLPIQ